MRNVMRAMVMMVCFGMFAGCGAPIVVSGRTCVGADNCFEQNCEIWRGDEGKTVCTIDVSGFSSEIRQDAVVTYRGQSGSAYAEVDPVEGYAVAGACLDTFVWGECVEVDTREELEGSASE